MRGKNLDVIGKCEKFLMNTRVHDPGKLLWRVGWREVRPADIANEESVPGENCTGPIRVADIIHQNANAFKRVSRSLQEPEPARSEAKFVSVLDRDVSELRPGTGADEDASIG